MKNRRIATAAGPSLHTPYLAALLNLCASLRDPQAGLSRRLRANGGEPSPGAADFTPRRVK